MSKTTIYLIRHGESQANERDVFLGHFDLDLTERGHMQAEKTALYLKDIYADAIYSSDLLRAYHTAEHTARLKNMEIIKNEMLREIDAGEWDNQSFSFLEENFAEEYALWCNDVGRAGCIGGESVSELMARVSVEVERLAKKNEGKTIMIFTHATPIRALKVKWDNMTLDEMKTVPWATNASVTKAEYENGEFKIIEYSRDSFLGDMITALPDNV